MTVRRASTLAAVVALVAAAAAVLLTLGRAGLAGAGAAPSPAAAPPPAPAITDSTWPLYSTAPAEPSAPPPSPSAEPGKATSTVAVAPAAPFVQHFADGPTASPLPKQKSPTAPLKVSAFVDGCDHNYGTRTQCVPLTFPDGITGVEAKCAWLAAHGFTNLIVAGQDSQGLDPDGDGTACRP